MKKRAEEYKAYVKYSFPVVDILGEFFFCYCYCNLYRDE